MNFSPIRNQSILGLGAFFLMTATQAGTPVLNFKLNGSPVINLDATDTTTVSYTITNNSKRPHSLALLSTPTGIVNSGGLCIVSGKTQANPTCTLTLTINASALPSNRLTWAPILCEANPNGTPNANQCFEPCHDKLDITRNTTPGTTTLSTSIAPPSILALSVKNTGKDPALTGNARQITFTNTGIIAATGLSVTVSGLPDGSDITTVPTTCTGSLAPGATCMVTITPGIDSTTDCKIGIAPASGTITLSANNVTSPAVSNLVVLDYGCQYQGGFLFSVDDSTPKSGSINGKIMSLKDQALPYIPSGPRPESVLWVSNGGTSPSFDIIPYVGVGDYTDAKGLFEAQYVNANIYPLPPETAFNVCTFHLDGQCNSSNLLTFYDAFVTHWGETGAPPPYTLSSGPTDYNLYAAGVCKLYTTDYSDWYLPSVCEMSTDNNMLPCPSDTQSISKSVGFLIGDRNDTNPSTSCMPPSGAECISGTYWSSTGSLDIFQQDHNALCVIYDFPTAEQQDTDRLSRLGVRCVRNLS